MRETDNSWCLVRAQSGPFSATSSVLCLMCLERQILSINTHADPIIGGVEASVI